MTNYTKFIMSLLPFVTIVGGWVGFDVTPEWWTAVASAATPVLVWAFPNKE